MKIAILKAPTSAQPEAEIEAVNPTDLRRKFVTCGVPAGAYVLAVNVGERWDMVMSRRRLYLTVKLPFVDAGAAGDVWELARKAIQESVFVTEQITEIANFAASPTPEDK